MLYYILSGESPLTETRDRLARLNISRFREVPPLSQLAPDLPNNVVTIVQKAMEFNPEKRYQNPTEILDDMRATLDRLGSGDTMTAPSVAAGRPKQVDDSVEGRDKTIMLVESKIEFQDLIREKLKKRGYRVLVISDPERALSRFEPDDEPAADCVLFSAPELGAAALEAFNRFGEEKHTADIPAILLVDRKQQFVIRSAKVNSNRMMLAMPLKVRELRTALIRLLQSSSTQKA